MTQPSWQFGSRSTAELDVLNRPRLAEQAVRHTGLDVTVDVYVGALDCRFPYEPTHERAAPQVADIVAARAAPALASQRLKTRFGRPEKGYRRSG